MANNNDISIKLMDKMNIYIKNLSNRHSINKYNRDKQFNYHNSGTKQYNNDSNDNSDWTLVKNGKKKRY